MKMRCVGQALTASRSSSITPTRKLDIQAAAEGHSLRLVAFDPLMEGQ